MSKPLKNVLVREPMKRAIDRTPENPDPSIVALVWCFFEFLNSPVHWIVKDAANEEAER